MYSVVEFTEDSGAGVAIVHSKWLTPRKKETYWPPYKDGNIFNRALRKAEEVTDQWKLYGIARHFCETDDLEKAQKKLKLAEHTSDLNTDVDDIFTQKRLKKTVKRLYSDTSSEEGIESQYERPPTVKVSKAMKGNQNSLTNANYNRTTTQSCSTPKSNREDRSQQSHIISKSINPSVIEESYQRANHNWATTQSCSAPKSNKQDRSQQSDIISRSRGSSVIESNETVLLRKLLHEVYFIKEQNKEILSVLNNNTYVNNERGNEISFLPKLPVKLPITSTNDMEVLDSFIIEDNHMLTLSSYLSTLGGRDLSSRVNRILRQLFTDAVAVNYNYCGLREKRAFNNLRLKTCIVGAVKAVLPNFTEKNVEDCIKVWLKHAPQRISRLSTRK